MQSTTLLCNLAKTVAIVKSYRAPGTTHSAATVAPRTYDYQYHNSKYWRAGVNKEMLLPSVQW